MNEDFLDLLTALNAADARFLVVGGYAVGVHGHIRATKDLDLWVEASPENARRVIKALCDFGAPLGDLTAEDLEHPGTGFKMGTPPRRIDILTEISGVVFEDAWPCKVDATFGKHVVCGVICIEQLLENKRAAARPQDLADVEALEQIVRLSRHSM